jgi:hypothetical protein
MRTAYRTLAALIALEVVIQAMVMVFAISGLAIWIDEGGVADAAAFEGEAPFPEFVGLIVHGINGMMVVPALALLLLISSFFAKVPQGVKWAAIVLVLVVTQVALGLFGHEASIFGALHGLNAFLLLGAAGYTAHRARDRVAAVPARERQLV